MQTAENTMTQIHNAKAVQYRRGTLGIKPIYPYNCRKAWHTDILNKYN